MADSKTGIRCVQWVCDICMRKQRNNKSLIVLYQKDFETKIKELPLNKDGKICTKGKLGSID